MLLFRIETATRVFKAVSNNEHIAATFVTKFAVFFEIGGSLARLMLYASTIRARFIFEHCAPSFSCGVSCASTLADRPAPRRQSHLGQGEFFASCCNLLSLLLVFNKPFGIHRPEHPRCHVLCDILVCGVLQGRSQLAEKVVRWFLHLGSQLLKRDSLAHDGQHKAIMG
jgi:hypothetical protein